MTYAGPQVDIPVGLPETPSTNIGAWQGLTIKEILEKVDLSNIIMEDDSKKNLAKNDPMVGHINPESAFLGPKLWSRPALSMPNNGGNEDYSVMNIDDFLSENGFDLNEEHESLGDSSEQEQSEIGIESPRSTSDMDMDQVETHQVSPVSSKKKNIPFKKRLSEQIELLKMKVNIVESGISFKNPYLHHFALIFLLNHFSRNGFLWMLNSFIKALICSFLNNSYTFCLLLNIILM